MKCCGIFIFVNIPPPIGAICAMLDVLGGVVTLKVQLTFSNIFNIHIKISGLQHHPRFSLLALNINARQ